MKCRYLVPVTVVLDPVQQIWKMMDLNLTQLIFELMKTGFLFFESVAEVLTVCRNFAEVEEIARGSEEAVEGFRMPSPCVSKPVSGRLDDYAASLLQPEAQDRVFALCVAGDGNCFFRSLSLLLFGTQNHHQELRCRIVMAMAINTALFLDGTNWCSSHDQVTPESVIEVALMTSVLPTASSPKLALEAEVMSVLLESTNAGLWEFWAASHVLKWPAQSVFPAVGWETYREHCNRIIRAPGCLTEQKVFVMWSLSRTDAVAEHWVSNHFVSRMLREQCIGAAARKRGVSI